MSKPKQLVLLPVPIQEDRIDTLSPRSLDYFENITCFVAEDPKTLRGYLSKICPKRRLSSIEIFEIPQKSDYFGISSLIEDLEEYAQIGLVSEAGNPCIADPGFLIVNQAHKKGWKVVPIEGPSSILQALMASGFSGQNFEFLGYLPRESSQLRNTLKRISKDVQRMDRTVIFMETPYRNRKLIDQLCVMLDDSIKLCIASGLSSKDEVIKLRKISSWKKTNTEYLHKIPAIFVLSSD